MASQTTTTQSAAVATPKPESRAARTIREIFQSGRPLTYIRSAEEHRVASILREVAQHLNNSAPIPIWTWSLTDGAHREEQPPQAGSQDPRRILDFIVDAKGPAIFHLKDFHEPMRDSPEIRRRLRDVYSSAVDQQKYVVIS